MVDTFRTIQATNELVAFCDQAKKQGWLALDTEFVRTRTFYAQLGLVQLCTGEQAYLLDPLSQVDLAPLWALLAEPGIETVMHAGGEDIEIIHHEAQQPNFVFDTQIAWAFLHEGEQIGYAPLVARYFQVTLDKSCSRTDWLKRPLSAAQQVYAAADAYYLARIYPALKREIEQHPLVEIFYAECRFRAKKRAQEVVPKFAWRDIGAYMNLSGVQCAIFAALAAWRLKYAKQHNLALPFVMRDTTLVEIAVKQPEHLKALSEIEGVSAKMIRLQGDVLLAQVQQAQAQSSELWPPAIPRLDNHPAYKAWFKEAKKKVKALAGQLELAETFIASRKQLNDVFIWENYFDSSLKQSLTQPDLLQSWRAEYIGQDLVALLQSKL